METEGQPRSGFFRRLWRSRWRWVVLVVVVIAAVIGVASARSKPEPSYVSATVERRDLQQVVEAAGKVESATALELAFSAGGSVATVNVGVGQKVTSGQLLASVSARQQEAQVAVARAALQAAQADQLRVASGSSAESRAVAQQQVVQAQGRLDAAVAAQATLEQQHQSDVASWQTLLSQSLSTNVFVGVRAIDEIDRILTDADAESVYRITSNAYSTALVDNTVIRNQFVQLANQPGAADVTSALQATQRLLGDTRDLLQQIFATTQLSQSEIDGFKATVATQQANVSVGLSAVESARAALANGQASYAAQLSSAASTIADARTALAVAQAQAQVTAAPARPFELAQAQARIAQAQGDLQRASATLEDYRLRAPVSGVVTRVDVRVGEQSAAGTPAVSILGSVPLEVKVKVAEADIAKVAVGQTATVTLDAFGDSRIFPGTVSAVDLAPTLVDGVVYYAVSVAFSGESAEVKLGMSGDAAILTASRSQILVIPVRAIKSSGDKRYVQVVAADGQLEDRTVTVGIRGEDGLAEITSGLNEGENVVTLNRTAP